MTAPTCCSLHSTTCGHLDVCCRDCPVNRESTAQLIAAALTGVLVLVLFALGVS